MVNVIKQFSIDVGYVLVPIHAQRHQIKHCPTNRVRHQNQQFVDIPKYGFTTQ
jgi:hypothetical protein